MDIYEQILNYKKNGKDAVLVTAVEKMGEGPVAVGKKMLISEDNEGMGTVGGGCIEIFAREKCKEIIKDRKNLLERYLLDGDKVTPGVKTLPMVCGGVVTLFYEFLGSKAHIYLFGAGHVSQALANVLKTMDFHLTVIDNRGYVIEKFEGADRRHKMGFVDFIEKEGIKENSFVVVCTPNHKHDYHVVNKILKDKIKVKYMGMLCSPDKLKDYLDKTYETFGEKVNLDNFHAPIGLDLGGGSPEEIAISITSEILAISNGKKGHRHMRETIDDSHRYWHD